MIKRHYLCVIMRVNTPILKEEELSALELGYRTGKSHCYRTRCHCVLLKAGGRYSSEVGEIVGMHHNSVNFWLKRFKSFGLEGLKTAPGRGRKPLMSVESDGSEVMAFVKEHRQRVSVAKHEWETSKDKEVSRTTFRRFLKELADDTSVSGSAAREARG